MRSNLVRCQATPPPTILIPSGVGQPVSLQEAVDAIQNAIGTLVEVRNECEARDLPALVRVLPVDRMLEWCGR